MVVGGILALSSAAMLFVSVLNLRDDRFRHHCVDQKRVYDGGACLGLVTERVLERTEPKGKQAKDPRERTFAELAQACDKLGGWLGGAVAGVDKPPRCVIPGGPDIDPP